MRNEYLGTGIKQPYVIDQYGRIELISGKDLIKQSIIRILNTKQKSVFYNRDFGSLVHTLVFEPNDAVLFSLLDYHVITPIEKWEKRVENVNTEIKRSETNPSLVEVKITYKVLKSNEIDSFIYPFYTELEY